MEVENKKYYKSYYKRMLANSLEYIQKMYDKRKVVLTVRDRNNIRDYDCGEGNFKMNNK